MKKTINVKEPTELELIFTDGKSLLLLFDVEALTNFSNLRNGLTGYIKEKSLAKRTAMILYAAHLHYNSAFTYEEAKRIIANLDPATVMAINLEFTNNIGMTDNADMQDMIKKNLREILETAK